MAGIIEKGWNKFKKTVSPYIPKEVKEFVRPVTKKIDSGSQKADTQINKGVEWAKKEKERQEREAQKRGQAKKDKQAEKARIKKEKTENARKEEEEMSIFQWI